MDSTFTATDGDRMWKGPIGVDQAGASPASVAAVVDGLVQRAQERAGLEDLGADGWREGLALLVETVESTPDVSVPGRDDLYNQFVNALWNRLRVVDYANAHPEVRSVPIERPLVVLGLPRTGTTVASCLLDQDPGRRSLLNWEAADSVPPSDSATLRTDPRCLAKKAELDALAEALQKEKFPIPHWEDADGPTECNFVQNQDFKALYWEAMMPTSAYGDWFLDADVTSAYEYERLVLQVLQSKAPGVWSLKMPGHAVHVDTLLETFPDARLVWAHRDPFKVTGSFLSLNQLSRPLVGGADFDIATMVPSVLQMLREHVERPLRTRERIGDDRFYHLHYANLMRNPVAEMRSLYEWAGDPLTPEVEKAMLGWLERNPQDRFGRRAYALDAFGLGKADLEPVYGEYLAAFDIEMKDL